MSPDDPRHGTKAGWSQHYREGSPACEPCLEARRRYQRVLPHLHALGKAPKIELGEVAYSKIRALSDAGFTQSQMERATGSAASCLGRYLEIGPSVIVRRKVRNRLEQVNPAEAIAARLTHIGTIRRAQALGRIGYSAQKIAPVASLGPDPIALLMTGRAISSSDTTRRKIDQAYRLLHMKPLDPAHDRHVSRTINRATKLGWQPPLAWDDIDDPNEQPKKPDQKPPVRPTVIFDVLEDFDWLVSQGEAPHIAAERIGVKLDTVQAYRTRVERDPRYREDVSA